MAYIDPSKEGPPSIFTQSFGAERRKGLFFAIGFSFLLFQLLFLANSSYIFGVLFRSSTRVQAFNILLVDNDHGAIGQSIKTAYAGLQQESFPTLDDSSSSKFGTLADVQSAVCRGDYWGAIYIEPSSSQQLQSTLVGNISDVFNASLAAVAVNVGIRYPIAQSSYISPAFESIFGAARAIYIQETIELLPRNTDLANFTTLATVLSMPFNYSTLDLAPTPQGSTPFYNTAVTVFIILMQFFCILALNGICQGFDIFAGSSIKSQLLLRAVYSTVFTFVGSCLTVVYIWAFRESWVIHGTQYIESWMIIWLSMLIHWFVLDAVAGFLPISAVPFATFTWIIINLASTVMPFEISPGFYRLGYAFPAHNTLEILIQIWSDGCYNRLNRTLPILFVWCLASIVADVLAQSNRVKQAIAARMSPSHESIKASA